MVAAYALIVPLSEGETARRIVASLGIGRADLKLGRRDGLLLIPIREPRPFHIPQARVELAEFEPYAVPRTYKEIVDVPQDVRALLPSAFDVVGDLVLIKLPEPLRAHRAAIGAAILQAHPNIKGVFHDAGVAGALRLRRLVHLAGEQRTQTVHTEYGARFHVDLATAYFSPRLANEHQRVAQSVRPGEHFVDATAGVGPFTILAARREIAARISAIDLNPDALFLLRRNLELNRVQDRVDVHEGDAVQVLTRLNGFHRAVINLPHGGATILDAAWKNAAQGATIHYTCMVNANDLPAEGQAILRHVTSLSGRQGLLQGARTVHDYSPSEVIAAFDLQVVG